MSRDRSEEPLPGVRTPVSGGTFSRRTLDERAAIKFPALARLFGAVFMRLSPRSRLRQLILVRRIRLAYSAQGRRDYDSVLAGWHPDCEYRPSRDLMPPDMEAAFFGAEGMRELWRYWRDAFDDIRWDPEEVEDFGEKLLVTAQQQGHGSGSGVGVSEAVFQLFTLRGGLVAKQEDFLDRSAALKAAEE